MRNAAVRGGIGAALVLFLALGPAYAAPSLARIKTTAGEAFVQRAEQQFPARPGLVLQQADVLSTGADGRMALMLPDNTRFSLGPDSRLTLTRFELDRLGEAGAVEARVDAGSLAIVSGRVAKTRPDAMLIRTPTALLGVRGTRFVVEPGLPSQEQSRFYPSRIKRVGRLHMPPPDRVVLLEGEQGQDTGALAVLGSNSDELAVLNQPNTEASVRPDEGVGQRNISPRELGRRYGRVVSALPPPPVTFDLYFDFDSTELIADSREQLDAVRREIERRGEGGEIRIVGHTDRAGQEAYNETLSRRRAALIGQLLGADLARAGVTSERITMDARGESGLLVGTRDGVVEERNRRVHIAIR